MELLERLADHAARRGDSLAIRAHGPCAEVPLSFAELWSAVRATADLLASKAAPGATVILACANRPEFAIAYFGTLLAGMTVFPMYPRSTAAEFHVAATASLASLAIAEVEAVPHLEGIGLPTIPVLSLRRLPVPRADASSVAVRGLLLQSSGTTGLPKIVVRAAASLDAVAANVAAAAGLSPEDRVLGVVPLGHSYGMENALLGPIWAGACVHLCDGFDVPVVSALLAGGATVLPGSAFMFEMLGRFDNQAPKAGSLRLAYSAGSPLPPGAAEGFAGRYGVGVGQLYGATEVGSVTFNDPGPPSRPTAGFDATSIGRPMNEVCIITRPCPAIGGPEPDQHGELLVRAPSMFSGYLNGGDVPVFESYQGHRWFATGDLGRHSADGCLWITGRLKLFIDIGGVKVNPLEVERVLEQHPLVGRSIVVPVPVSATVNRVKAIVTPRNPGDAVDADSLRRFARERLAAYKLPRVIEVRPSLPLTPTGKVARSVIAAEVAGAAK